MDERVVDHQRFALGPHAGGPGHLHAARAATRSDRGRGRAGHLPGTALSACQSVVVPLFLVAAVSTAVGGGRLVGESVVVSANGIARL